MSKQEIETLGAITKAEELSLIEHNIVSGTLVLESNQPYPGYHGSLFDTTKPMPLYFVLKERYSMEKILRAIMNVRKYYTGKFDAASSRIHIYNDDFYALRLRDLQSFEDVALIQSYFMDEGVQFHKSKKISGKAIVRIQKHFVLENLDCGIYNDLVEEEVHYIKIKQELKWSHFENISNLVKNNLDFTNFDAALGVMYRIDKLDDVIRIFGPKLELFQLKQIRDKYKDQIDHYLAQ